MHQVTLGPLVDCGLASGTDYTWDSCLLTPSRQPCCPFEPTPLACMHAVQPRSTIPNHDFVMAPPAPYIPSRPVPAVLMNIPYGMLVAAC